VLLENRCYVYETRCGDDALIVALNLADTPLTLRQLGGRNAQLMAGTGAPPEQVVSATKVPAHGWQVLRPT
jgi:hypothetical protein